MVGLRDQFHDASPEHQASLGQYREVAAGLRHVLDDVRAEQDRTLARELGEQGAAHLFQTRVDKVADLRVTVVGRHVFCVRIDSGLLDWRQDYDRLSYAVVEPPPGLAEGCLAYVEHLGLRFGAFDFALTADGAPVFLECNPNGQWGWLEDATGLPIAAALADLLLEERP